jgi:hypothetical protein
MFKYFSCIAAILSILLVLLNPIPYSNWFAFAAVLFGCGYGFISIIKEKDRAGRNALRLNAILVILISFQLL